MSDEETPKSQESLEEQHGDHGDHGDQPAKVEPEKIDPAIPGVDNLSEEGLLALEESDGDVPAEGEYEEGGYEEHSEETGETLAAETEEDEQSGEETSWKGPLTEADIAECKEAFFLFDKNADGCIDAGELLEVLHSLSRTPSDVQVQRMMREVTQRQDSGDGGIAFDDFIGMIERIIEERDSEEKIREAFQVFDKEGSGRISASVLRQALTSLCDRMTDEEVDQMIHERDIDEEGTVDIELLVKQICEIRLGEPHSECELTPQPSTEVSEDCNRI